MEPGNNINIHEFGRYGYYLQLSTIDKLIFDSIPAPIKRFYASYCDFVYTGVYIVPYPPGGDFSKDVGEEYQVIREGNIMGRI